MTCFTNINDSYCCTNFKIHKYKFLINISLNISIYLSIIVMRHLDIGNDFQKAIHTI